MLTDFFASANLMTTLLCIAALVLAGVIQYRLCLSSVHGWLRQLPTLICSGAAALFLALVFFTFLNNAWYALSWLFAMLFAVLLLIACTIGRIAAHYKQHKTHNGTPRT